MNAPAKMSFTQLAKALAVCDRHVTPLPVIELVEVAVRMPRMELYSNFERNEDE